VRVNLVVVGDPRWQLMHHGLGIRTRTDADVIAFDRAHKSFGHSIALWTFDRRRPGFETDGAVAANLEAVRAPAPIALIHCDPTVVPPLGTAAMAIEQETAGLHHSVDTFVIGLVVSGGQRSALASRASAAASRKRIQDRSPRLVRHP
jgi:hypothetical protein